MLAERDVRFFQGIAEAVHDVERRTDGWTVERIATDESFLAAVERAVRAMREDATEEKRRYLLNALRNAGGWGAEPEIARTRFVQLTARYSPVHVELLLFFRDPAEWLRSHGRRVCAYLAGSLNQVLGEQVFPGSPLYPEEAGRAVGELNADGLLDTAGSGMMTGSGLLQRRIKPYGERYLAFIEVD